MELLTAVVANGDGRRMQKFRQGRSKWGAVTRRAVACHRFDRFSESSDFLTVLFQSRSSVSTPSCIQFPTGDVVTFRLIRLRWAGGLPFLFFFCFFAYQLFSFYLFFLLLFRLLS
jgi:hypothetical protein